MADPENSSALEQRISAVSERFGLPDEAREAMYEAVLTLFPQEHVKGSPDGTLAARPSAPGRAASPLRPERPSASHDLAAAPFSFEPPTASLDLASSPFGLEPPTTSRGPAAAPRALEPRVPSSAAAPSPADQETIPPAPPPPLMSVLLSEPPPFTETVLQAQQDPLSRYQDLGHIDAGGMGEVRRVRDRTLKRTMAMKIIRSELMKRPAVVARFIEEAQATAQLQHPGIVPVHELGRLQDGRLYFTMKEVQGVTLKALLQEVHASSTGGRWETTPTGWNFRKLIDAFLKVCESVAYAHSRGVVHRDLKPSNVMVGSFGEVLVLDWGLAKVRGRPTPVEGEESSGSRSQSEEIETERTGNTTLATHVGTITGTPAYMSPEQARGEADKVGPASDVYALGAILYEILSGRPPYNGPTLAAVLMQVLGGPPIPPGRTGNNATILTSIQQAVPLEEDMPPTPLEASDQQPGPPLPEELVAICLKAMAREPHDRYPDAKALAAEIEAWLDGAQRRERALRVVEEAEALLPEVARLRERASSLRAEAVERLAKVQPADPVARKLPGWNLEDEARQLEREADLKETEFVQKLQGALTYVPDLPQAHDDLAAFYWRLHRDAERQRDSRARARLEVLLRAHDRGRYTAYLKGDGALTLVTDPPRAEVSLYRYVERDRRLEPEFVRKLGRTPLHAVSLPMGSYLLRIRAMGRAEVLYPVCIGRQHHWDGIRPGDSQPFPIYLPRAEELGPDDCYVPAGWFWTGGDLVSVQLQPHHRVWVDACVIRRFPITNREYLEFLNDLVAKGKRREALRVAPRERGARENRPGPVIYGRDESGRFYLKADAEGDEWMPEWPVIMIDWPGAHRYSRWEAERTGQPWRLAYELEWEKAGRGVDGRLLPWGDFIDPTWANTHDSVAPPARPLIAEVDSYPVDVSPYGVRGMAGNVRDWCQDVYRREGPWVENDIAQRVDPTPDDPEVRRIVRGGCWFWPPARIRLAHHQGVEYYHRDSVFGFRLARSIEPR